MIVDLLAADPRTPPATAAWLAERTDLTARTALILAANPALPPGAPLRPRGATGDLLTAALTRPLAAARRAQFLAGAGDLTSHIDAGAPLTTAEIAAHHRARPPATLEEHVAYATHPATSRAIAVAALTAAFAIRSATREVDPYTDLLIEAASIRHHAPVTDRARAALATPDPGATYARHLVARVAAPGRGDWQPIAALHAHPHPVLITALLTAAADEPRRLLHRLALAQTTHHDPLYRDGLAQILHRASTVPALDRFTALTLTAPSEPARRAPAARQAPDHLILAIATTQAALINAFHNPNASPATLTALHHAAATPTGAPRAPVNATDCEVLATHPNTPPALRTELLTHTDHPHTLSRQLARAATPTDLLDLPYGALRAEEGQTHAPHWAHRAYTAHPNAHTVTAEQAQALITLDAGRFSGTLRELLHAARTLAT